MCVRVPGEGKLSRRAVTSLETGRFPVGRGPMRTWEGSGCLEARHLQIESSLGRIRVGTCDAFCEDRLGGEACLAEAIDTRQFIFIFDEVKPAFTREKKKILWQPESISHINTEKLRGVQPSIHRIVPWKSQSVAA